MDLVALIYGLTVKSPKEEIYGLTAQMKRSAVSIPSNIAEGRARDTRRDYRHFVHLARGSACELETQLLLSVDLGFVSRPEADPILVSIAELQRILNGLIRSLTD